MPLPDRSVAAQSAIDPTAVRPPIADAEIIRADRLSLRATLERLRREGCSVLLDVGCVDYLPREPRYDVVYHLLALPVRAASVAEVGTPRRVRLLVGVAAGDETLPSIVDLWPAADWPEREIFDLFGIRFAGHPNLRRVQMPDDWEGHPLRKDYPLRGPAREATPRPAFALKSNVSSGTPPTGRVAEALQRHVARIAGTEDRT